MPYCTDNGYKACINSRHMGTRKVWQTTAGPSSGFYRLMPFLSERHMAPTHENFEVLQTKQDMYSADDVIVLFGFVPFICIIECVLCDRSVLRFPFQTEVT